MQSAVHAPWGGGGKEIFRSYFHHVTLGRMVPLDVVVPCTDPKGLVLKHSADPEKPLCLGSEMLTSVSQVVLLMAVARFGTICTRRMNTFFDPFCEFCPY